MKQYTLVSEDNESRLESEVNKLIAEGYVPLGGVSIAYGFCPENVPECRDVFIFAQAMIKDSE